MTLIYDRLNKIAKTFNVKLVKIELVESKLEDGTIIQYDELVVGNEIKVVTQDGIVPIEDGTYVIAEEDMKYTVVTLNGKIDSVNEFVEEVLEEVVVEETPEVETEVPEAEIPATEVNYEERIVSLENAVANLVSVLEGLGVTLSETIQKNTDLELKLKEFEKKPAKEVIVDNSNLTPSAAERIQAHNMFAKRQLRN
jgi:uncharacterized coiled-coil protein SlyX